MNEGKEKGLGLLWGGRTSGPCGFCLILFVKEPASGVPSRNFPFPTFLIAKARMRESQNYCLPVGLFLSLKLLPKFFSLCVLDWNAMDVT